MLKMTLRLLKIIQQLNHYEQYQDVKSRNSLRQCIMCVFNLINPFRHITIASAGWVWVRLLRHLNSQNLLHRFTCHNDTTQSHISYKWSNLNGIRKH